jgi:hypothetical protein
MAKNTVEFDAHKIHKQLTKVKGLSVGWVPSKTEKCPNCA